MRPSPARRLFCTSLVLLLLVSGAAGAQSANEVAVKIGFVFNFLKFIEWPAEAASRPALVLCSSGSGPVGDDLALLEGKSVNGKNLVVRQQVQGAALRECHLLYLVDPRRYEAILPGLRGHPVVTVADDHDFIHKGGMIGLIPVGERLGFEVNLDSAQAGRVRIGAPLLKLAQTVLGGK